MKIEKINHVSINIIDSARSFDFYERVLGLRQQETVDCGEFDITYFGLPDGSRLELFDYHGKNNSLPRLESEVGLRHLAFEVKDVAAHEAYLRSQGVKITLATCDLPNLGVRVMLFLDPNDVTLEFCEPL
ncbi:MAG: VOC family protein [Anaerolineae bacterium]|nr:VOC family protein [Anaerolineae bacterium]